MRSEIIQYLDLGIRSIDCGCIRSEDRLVILIRTFFEFKIEVDSMTNETALLITDPSHSLPVQVNRNGLRAIAKGTGSQTQLEIPHLPNNSDIKVGDLLVTSGLGCVFPAGYPAARVVEINIDPSLPFAEVLAEPIAELDRSREVLLVWPGGKAKPNPANPCQLESEAPAETGDNPVKPAKEKKAS